jgi:hypothetical protein
LFKISDEYNKEIWTQRQILTFQSKLPAGSTMMLKMNQLNSLNLSVYGFTALVDLGRFFSFLIYTQSLGLLGRRSSPSQGCYLHRITKTQNKRTQTSMPRVGFEPTISVFERAKTVHTLNRAASVIDRYK